MNNNSKLTTAVQVATGQTKLQAEASIQAVLSSIKNIAIADGKVTMQGYGSFTNTLKPARQGRNPKTGEALTISAREVFGFKAAK